MTPQILEERLIDSAVTIVSVVEALPLPSVMNSSPFLCVARKLLMKMLGNTPKISNQQSSIKGVSE
jgi:hypothetical protein